MTDEELRKLKRADLIEILYYLKKENEELTEENQKLKDQLYALVGDAIRLHRQDNAGGQQTPEGAKETPEAQENV